MKAFEDKKKYLLIADKDDFWYPLMKYRKYMSLNSTDIEFLDYYGSGYEDQYIIDSFDKIEDAYDTMCEYYYFHGYENGKLEKPLKEAYGQCEVLSPKKGLRKIIIIENILKNLYYTRDDLLEKMEKSLKN